METKDFWNRVKILIKQNNTTQEGLAKSINIPFHTLQGQIVKNRLPNIIDGYNIATVLNTTVEFLITGEEKGIPQEIIKVAYEINALPTMFKELLFGNLEMYKHQCLQQAREKVSDAV